MLLIEEFDRRIPVPKVRDWVCDTNAPGVESNKSAVVTIPSARPWVRWRYSPMDSTRGLSPIGGGVIGENAVLVVIGLITGGVA